jgi:hypothetical protein
LVEKLKLAGEARNVHVGIPGLASADTRNPGIVRE